MCDMMVLSAFTVFFFFFKQKTAYEMRISDWSSDVCSSDLLAVGRISMSGHGIETLSIPTWPKSVLRRGHSVLDNQDRNRARPDSENVATLPNGAGSRRPSFVLSRCSADERKAG